MSSSRLYHIPYTREHNEHYHRLYTLELEDYYEKVQRSIRRETCMGIVIFILEILCIILLIIRLFIVYHDSL
jgi:hypothetical protein